MTLSATTLRRAFTVSVASAATVAVTAGSFSSVFAQSKGVTLNGAGATFPKPLYDRYFAAFKQETGTQVNYQAIGSGGGIRQFAAGTVDFGASDAYPTGDQRAQMKRGLVMVPTAGGAVAVVYNVSGVNNLKLSRQTLPAIFSGQITRWNDPKIAKDNPGAKLPNTPIRLAVRSDSSGTSNIFSSHLAAISPAFKSSVGASTTPNWRGNKVAGKGNPGVAALVKQTQGAIGYVESAYATQNNIATAQVQNKAGQFVSPTLQQANAAFSTATFTSDFRAVGLENPAKGYPIVGTTWLLIHQKYPNAAKGQAVKNMVNWILTKGQQYNDDLGYTSIPQRERTRVQQAVASLGK